jgi:TP901 family phage tail tape measure protein
MTTLNQNIQVDASGALSGAQQLNATIDSIGTTLARLNDNLSKTTKALAALDQRTLQSFRNARDAAISLGRAANETVAAVQKATSGLASIDAALEKRVDRVRQLRRELQGLSGTALSGGPGGGGGGGNGNGLFTGNFGGGGGGNLPRLGDVSSLSAFSQQLERQFIILAQSRVFFGIKDQIVDATSAAKELNARVTEIQTITQTADRTTKDWTDSMLRLSSALGRPAVEVADAAYQLLSNQIRGAGARTEELTLQVGQFANVTRTTLPGAVDALSSVLNSYGDTADKAGQRSAQLFKAIELGKFRGEELATSIGKVAPVASHAGVSLEELLATYTALTVQGQNLNTSSTLVLNVINALIKPNKELAQFYRTQGVSSGQEFIQMNGGLAGALSVLQKQTGGVATEINKFFSNIRAFRGIQALTADINRFTSDLGNIKNAENSFKLAVDIDENSANRTIDRFTERLKNRTIDELGNGLLKARALLGKVDEKTSIVTGEFGGAFLVQTAIIGGLVGKIAEFASQTRLAKIAATELTVGLGSISGKLGDISSSFFSNLNLFVTTATVAYLVGLKIFEKSKEQLSIEEEITREKKRQTKELEEARNFKQKTLDVVIKEDVGKAVASAADLRKVTQETFDRARQIVRVNLEAMTLGSSEAFTSVRNDIARINETINENKALVSNSQKSLGDFRANAQKSLFGAKLELANPDQQLKLVQDEMDRLVARGRQLITQGAAKPGSSGQDQIKEGNDLLAEAERLARQRFDLTKNTLGTTQLLNNLENDLLKIQNAKIQAQQTIQILKERENKTLQEQKDKEKLRLDQLEKLNREFININQKIADGTIAKQPEFQKQGRFVPDLVSQRLDLLSGEISRRLFEIDTPAAARFSVEVAKVLVEARKSVRAALADADAESNQKQLQEQREIVEKQRQVINTKSSELGANLTKPDTEGVAKNIKLLQDFIVLNSGEIDTLIFKAGSIFPKVRKSAEEQLIRFRQITDIISALKDIQKAPANQNGVIVLSPEQLTQLKAAQEALGTLREATSGTGNADLFRSLEKQLQETIKLATEVSSLSGANEQTLANLNDLANSDSPKQFNDSLNTLINTTNSQTAEFEKALSGLTATINNFQLNVAKPAGNFSSGGTVSAPQGMDTILAGLRPGETVMNPKATSLFGPLFSRMNNLASIPYGSANSITMGDVNVYVSGSNSAGQNVREMGNAIRREIRRGNLRM